MHLILCRISMDICIFPTRKDKILSLEDILKSSIDMPCLNLRAKRGTDNINIKTKQTNKQLENIWSLPCTTKFNYVYSFLGYMHNQLQSFYYFRSKP